MNIGERLSFNSKLMEFCLWQSNWSHKGNESEALDRYGDCVAKTIVAEQLFRAELNRTRPGVIPPPVDDDDE